MAKLFSTLLFLVAALALLSGLSGCATDSGRLTLTPPVTGEQIVQIGGEIKDASVQKEVTFTHMVENRDAKLRAMYEKSGFKQTWREVTKKTRIVTGGQETVIETTEYVPEVEFRERPHFEQPLPSGPSVHPFWQFANNTVYQGANALLWWTGITQGVDLLKNAQNKATPQYYGNYNPQTAEPYIVKPEVVTPVIVK